MAAERFFGKRIRRFEDPRLLLGKGAFLEDLQLPGMLHAAFVRSPYAHAEIRDVPTEAARVDGRRRRLHGRRLRPEADARRSFPTRPTARAASRR